MGKIVLSDGIWTVGYYKPTEQFRLATEHVAVINQRTNTFIAVCGYYSHPNFTASDYAETVKLSHNDARAMAASKEMYFEILHIVQMIRDCGYLTIKAGSSLHRGLEQIVQKIEEGNER
jgi:hypothetical protein